MEVTDENLQTLSRYLHQTLDPDHNVRRPAEKFLEGVEVNQNYPLLLLNLLDKDGVDATIRVASAITFKNYIKRNWPIDEDGVDRIHGSDRDAIKVLIVTLMLKSPEAIQKQLSDAVSIIGKYDFPEKWASLILEMVDKFATGDFHVINGVLRTAHSLFKRYRYEFKSEKLWQEIKHVLDRIAKPLTDLFVATIELTLTHANNPDALRVIYSSLVLVCKVFYSLNYQDIPEFFEDNMPIWMPNLLGLLQVNVPALNSDDDNTAGVIESLKAEVCECIALYAMKYDEEFAPHCPQFVTAVWSVLVSTGPEPKYDALVSNALGFLSRVADKHHYRNLFEDPSVLSSICEKVIIPNMQFRDSDLELFEDNAEEYIRRDIEGSDVDTRRRSACDLVKTLSVNFEEKIFQIFGQYINTMLSQYAALPSVHWRGADAALYSVSALVSRGSTGRAGVTRTSTLIDVAAFCNERILPELQRQDVNSIPVLKADALRYIMTFRTLLPAELVVASLPLVVRHLSSASAVVHSYAACCIEKVAASVGAAALTPLASDLFQGLFQLLDSPLSQDNDYVMKAVMRTLSVLQGTALPYLGAILPKLAATLALVSRNPSKPHFNHYLFETLSLAIKIVCKANPEAVISFESALFPIFQNILQQDVQEFMPYVFQMLSLLLELQSGRVGDRGARGEATSAYAALLPCLVAPPLWERPANVAPLARLLCAYVAAAPSQIIETGKLGSMLGVFQKLIASKTNDHEGFYLIQSMLYKLPRESMQPYVKQIITLLFQRLSSSKTTKYVRGLIAFFGFYVTQFGADNLIDLVDGIQNGMFGQYLERVLIPDLQKVSGALEVKMSAIGCIRILCDCPKMMEKYSHLWPPLIQAVISLFELPQDETTEPNDHFVEVDDAPGYQAAYSKLSHAQQGQQDLLQEISEPRQYLAMSLGAMSSSRPGALPPLLQSVTDPHRQALTGYLNKYGVQIY